MNLHICQSIFTIQHLRVMQERHSAYLITHNLRAKTLKSCHKMCVCMMRNTAFGGENITNLELKQEGWLQKIMIVS